MCLHSPYMATSAGRRAARWFARFGSGLRYIRCRVVMKKLIIVHADFWNPGKEFSGYFSMVFSRNGRIIMQLSPHLRAAVGVQASGCQLSPGFPAFAFCQGSSLFVLFCVCCCDGAAVCFVPSACVGCALSLGPFNVASLDCIAGPGC